MEQEIRQFKLITGEEIICHVVHEDESEVVLQLVLQMTSLVQEGYKYYTFKSFMTYQDREDSVISLNPDMIMSVAYPPEDLVREYLLGLNQMEKYNKEMDMNEADPDYDMEFDMGDSSGSSNVLPFKPTFH